MTPPRKKRASRKAPPEPACPACGCPESSTFARQSPGGALFCYDACNGCGRIAKGEREPPATAPAPPIVWPPSAHELLAFVLVAADGARDPIDGCRCVPKALLDDIRRRLALDAGAPVAEQRAPGETPPACPRCGDDDPLGQASRDEGPCPRCGYTPGEAPHAPASAIAQLADVERLLGILSARLDVIRASVAGGGGGE